MKLNTVIILIAGSVVGLTGGVGAEPVRTNLNLDAVIQMALANSPELRVAGARARSAVGRTLQARAWPNPELEITTEDWPIQGGRGLGAAKHTLGISQTLPYPGKKSLDRQIGQTGIRLSDAEMAVRRTETVRNAKAAFYQVLAAERMVAAVGELTQVAESSMTTARKRSEAGATAYQEQLRAEIQWEQAKTELNTMQRDLISARQTLGLMLGRPDLDTMALSGTLAETANASLWETPVTTWLGQHPCLAVGLASLERARLELRRMRLEPYPDVKVGLEGGRVGATDESIVGFRFSVPVPLFDRSKGRVQETQARVEEAEAELEVVRQQLQREWVQAIKRYRTAAEHTRNQRERILPKAAEALRLVQVGFAEGKFNFIDLVDTQRTAAEARLVYQQKLLELNLAQAELEALLAPQSVKTISK
ncbi:MAG: TolC family protein [Verrucomicrobiota bacterium]